MVANFTPVPRPDYRIGVPVTGSWVELGSFPQGGGETWTFADADPTRRAQARGATQVSVIGIVIPY